MGMAEQLLMAAAGAAKEGFIPFATTYAAFATRRAYDFYSPGHRRRHSEREDLRAALPGLDDRLWPQPGHRRSGDHARNPRDGWPSILAMRWRGAGGTGHCRSPNVGRCMRLLRGKVPLVLDKYDHQFELGKAKLLEDGNDVLIISSADDHARWRRLKAAGR
ncbi:hypothetical protein MJ579_09575 [Klebsiella pneumoniae]|nr:hypothetical protein MJ579_09575 [Klebsiella pneumoniae]